MKVDDSASALRMLQEHLGHANFDTTAKYRKIAIEEHRRGMTGCGAILLSVATKVRRR